MELSLEKENLVKFLSSLSSLSTQAIVSLKPNKIESIVITPDSTLFLYNEWVTDTGIDKDIKLSFPDVKKFVNICKFTEDNEPVISFKLGNNSLKYSNGGVKFTYHLHEEGLIASNALKPEKIRAMEETCDFIFELSRVEYQKLVKCSAFSGETNKIYFSTNSEGQVIGEITDKSKDNVDSFGIPVGIIIKGEKLSDISLNFDNFKMMNNSCDKFIVKFNQTIGICITTIVENDVTSTYVFTSFKN